MLDLQPRATVTGDPGPAEDLPLLFRAALRELEARAGVLFWSGARAPATSTSVETAAGPGLALLAGWAAVRQGRAREALVAWSAADAIPSGFIRLGEGHAGESSPLAWLAGVAATAPGALDATIGSVLQAAGIEADAIGAVDLSSSAESDLAAVAAGGTADAWLNLRPSGDQAFQAGLARMAEAVRCGQVFASAGPQDAPAGLRVASRAQPWLPPRAGRHALVVDSGGAAAVLSEPRPGACARIASRLGEHKAVLAPLAGATPAVLAAGLEGLAASLKAGESYQAAARRLRAAYQAQADAPFAAAVVARSQEEAIREAGFLLRRMQAPEADARTPGGSFTTREPVGPGAKIAFVYPGAGSAYLGLGGGLFGVFPGLFARLEAQDRNAAATLSSIAAFNPPGLAALGPGQVEALEAAAARDFQAQFYGSLFYAYALTLLAREKLGLRPSAALGYCIGELAMCGATGLWPDITQLNDRPALFRRMERRIYGDMEAVSDAWGPSPDGPSAAERWRTYVVFTSPSAAAEAVKRHPRVYLTIINTPGQVVIAGDAEGCQAVVAELACQAMPVPFNAPFHCPPVITERGILAEWYRLPVKADSSITYHTQHASPLPQEPSAVAEAISRTLTDQVDFPALVETAYAGGARIFVELGPRQMCSTWIAETLTGKPHLALPLDIKGADPVVALLRAAAQLIGHRARCDIAGLFDD